MRHGVAKRENKAEFNIDLCPVLQIHGKKPKTIKRKLYIIELVIDVDNYDLIHWRCFYLYKKNIELKYKKQFTSLRLY